MIQSVGSGYASMMQMQQMQPKPQAEESPSIAALIEQADSDGSLSLDESEFSALFSDESSSDASGLFAQMDADGDGSLTEAEVEDSVSQLLEQLQAAKLNQASGAEQPMGPPPGGPMGPPPSAETMVSDNDSDEDGLLSETEFAAMLSDKSESEISEMFSTADTDGDGYVSSSELETAMQNHQPDGQMPPPPGDASSLISELDVDESGSLDLSEFSTLFDDDESVAEALFTEADADGDGVVTESELQTAMDEHAANQVSQDTQRMLDALMTTYQSLSDSETSSISVSA